MRSKKLIYSFLGAALVLSFSFSTVLAAEFLRPDKSTGSVTVSQGEKVKNLYVGGNMVSIDADVEKSLYVGGNIITINGDVENNICAGGSTVIIRGKVGDSVHVGGGSIVIEGQIEEDLFVGGGNITITKSASIGGDLIIGGGNVNIEAPVTGDILVGGGNVTINSKVGGNVEAKVDELTLGSQAQIMGDLKYAAGKEVDIKEGATVIGEVDFEKRLSSKPWTMDPKLLIGFVTLGFLVKLLMMIVVGLVLIYLFRNITQQIIRESLSNFWSNLGRGFAALILTPVACVVLLITVIGIGLVGLIVPTYAFMLVLSASLAGIAFGSWLIKIVKKRTEYRINWQAVVVGIIGLKIVALIPLVGWLVGFVFMLISLGTLYRIAFQGLVSRK